MSDSEKHNGVTQIAPAHTLRKAAGQVQWNYNLARFNERIRAQATSPQIKNVREEIGILRICLEDQLKVLDPEDKFSLIQATSRIMPLIAQINQLVISCTKLEEKMGLQLDKNQVVQLGDAMVELIARQLQLTGLKEEECQVFLTNVVNGLGTLLTSIVPETGRSRSDSSQPNDSEPIRVESESHGSPVPGALDLPLSPMAERDA